ncbi:hypothetical protein SAMN03080601_00621 [Alkalitalea saponilacus]|uniref:Uncharacterized protein n=1 Tax=Alkalitalea saponilacus TaxID=889453 RepID=A0A1T5BTN1_9BACT|nr:hypothetical protein SAMN03080601_00621 [Alkalitalea saponilacus]
MVVEKDATQTLISPRKSQLPVISKIHVNGNIAKMMRFVLLIFWRDAPLALKILNCMGRCFGKMVLFLF